MNGLNKPQISASELATAQGIVSMRLSAKAVVKFPGFVPPDIESGYRCQDAAIQLWPDRIGGWKSTILIPKSMNPPIGHERIVGPIFFRNIHFCPTGKATDIPIFEDGLAGIEPELIAVIGTNAPPDKVLWTRDEAREMIGKLHIGAEIPSSPLAVITEMGLPALTADFCGNYGIVIGDPIEGWKDLSEIMVRCYMDNQIIDSGTTKLNDDPLDALAFILGKCASRGYPLTSGMAVSTGTITQFHPILPNQISQFIFDGIGEVTCHAVPATPSPSNEES